MANWPCQNHHCASFGKPHPNCICPNPEVFAKGGCVGPHYKSCEYFAEGGQVEEQNQFLNNPNDSVDHYAVHNGLLNTLTKLGSNGQSPNPGKHLEEYMDSSKRGHKTIDSYVKGLFGKDKMELEPDLGSRESLKSHLNDINQNPEKALQVGGQLGEIMPLHAAALGARAGNAYNYLSKLKPKLSQISPLDKMQPADRKAENLYNRQLDIAQKPHLVLQHIKNGTLQPLDLMTLKTLYPSLHQSMVSKAAESIIDAKEKGMSIPRKQRAGLSDLLGQPLDSIQSPVMMQAIIKANAPSQSPQSQKQPKKASSSELKQINKVNEQLATPEQKRLMGKS